MKNTIIWIGLAGILASPLATMVNPLLGGFVFGVGFILFLFSKGIEYELNSDKSQNEN